MTPFTTSIAQDRANMKTIIQKINAKPGQRILVTSDVHGHLENMVHLLGKLQYSAEDILVIVGDLVDKGPESLRTVRYIMELSSRAQDYQQRRQLWTERNRAAQCTCLSG